MSEGARRTPSEGKTMRVLRLGGTAEDVEHRQHHGLHIKHPRWRRALAAASLAVACSSGAPPAASPSSSSHTTANEQPQRITLVPGTPEYRAFLEHIHQGILRRRAAIEPILRDGDVAQLTFEGSKLSVARIDQTRAQHIADFLEREDPSDEVGRRWFRRRGGPGRIFVVMGEGSLLFNIDESGISLEPGSLIGR
jgi:hypothetical protein